MNDFIEQLNKITSFEPEALSDSDKEFLRARSSYLTDGQKAKYSEILGEQPQKKLKKSKK